MTVGITQKKKPLPLGHFGYCIGWYSINSSKHERESRGSRSILLPLPSQFRSQSDVVFPFSARVLISSRVNTSSFSEQVCGWNEHPDGEERRGEEKEPGRFDSVSCGVDGRGSNVPMTFVMGCAVGRGSTSRTGSGLSSCLFFLTLILIPSHQHNEAFSIPVPRGRSTAA